MAEHKRIQLVWVSECMGIDGNEIADIINQARLLKSTYRT
jgi:hypothetical protein